MRTTATILATAAATALAVRVVDARAAGETTVSASRFVLTDDQGVARATLGFERTDAASPPSPTLVFYGLDGAPSLRVGVEDSFVSATPAPVSYPFVLLKGGNRPDSTVSLACTTGPRLFLSGAEGLDPFVTLAEVGGAKPEMRLWGSRIEAVAGDQGNSGLTTIGAGSVTVGTFLGSSGVTLYGGEQALRAPSIELFNSPLFGGRFAGTSTTLTTGKPALTIRRADGRTRFRR